MENKEKLKLMQCKHCGNKTQFKLQGFYEIRNDLINEEQEEHPALDIEIWNLWECLTCEKPELERKNQIAIIEYNSYENSAYESIISSSSDIIFPSESTMLAPPPSSDMPEDIARDFDEARDIFNRSSRASAALLRLALQKLCIHLGQSGKNLNNDIAALVQSGLSIKIQQSLDIVRVIGNNAVHPGEIDLNDNKDTVLALFDIINFIVDEMISRPNKIDRIYNIVLPENARKSIEM